MAEHLRKLSRSELFTRLQVSRALDPLVSSAYKRVQEKKWREQLDNSPHGLPWHTSFHASQFPGDDPQACGRQAMYRLADFPQPEPTTRWLATLAAAGKGIEYELVKTLEQDGILISAGPDEEFQTGFVIEDVWLTGSVDCVIAPPGTNKPIPVEIKSKYQKVIDEMKLGTKGPDTAHVFQIKTQLALVRWEQLNGTLWADRDLVTHGYIYYLSRDKPSDTAEFRIDYDERFFLAGLGKLKEWKQSFLDDYLPTINPSKKHPMGWKWSYHPCQFCNYKKTCKLDFEQGVDKVSESVGVNRAKLVSDKYDFDKARQRVLDRWHGRGGNNEYDS